MNHFYIVVNINLSSILFVGLKFEYKQARTNVNRFYSLGSHSVENSHPSDDLQLIINHMVSKPVEWLWAEKGFPMHENKMGDLHRSGKWLNQISVEGKESGCGMVLGSDRAGMLTHQQKR